MRVRGGDEDVSYAEVLLHRIADGHHVVVLNTDGVQRHYHDQLPIIA
jgi:hypothetical protein